MLQESEKILGNAKKTHPAAAGWIPEIDYLRGFAAMAVIMVHTVLYSYRLNGAAALSVIGLFVGIFSLFAVPLFIMISGLVLHRQYNKNFPILSFYAKRFHILAPYATFTLAYVAFSSRFPDPFTPGVGTAPITPMYVLLAFLQAKSYGIMWFFAILIQFYLLYPMFAKLYTFLEKRQRLDLLLVGSLIAQIAWNSLLAPCIGVVPFLGTHLFLEEVFYFVLGMYVARNFDSASSFCKKTPASIALAVSLVLTLACTILLTIGREYSNYAQMLPKMYLYQAYAAYCIGPLIFVPVFVLMYKLAVRLSEKKTGFSSFVKNAGRLSFGIYLVHMMFNAATASLLIHYGMGIENWAFYPLIFISGIVFSYAAAKTISLLPYSEWIIGSSSFRKMRAKQ